MFTNSRMHLSYKNDGILISYLCKFLRQAAGDRDSFA